jgi:hypothetical protein
MNMANNTAITDLTTEEVVYQPGGRVEHALGFSPMGTAATAS